MGNVDRKQLGAWYTPEPLVEFVLDRVSDGIDGDRVRSVLDPSCGDGRFLRAAARRWPTARLAGVDIDAEAVSAAHTAVADATIVHADALSYAWPDGGTYDLVVGNPPFLGQMSSATTRGGRSKLGGGAYADTAALFMAQALGLARPDGGRVAFVLPQSFLAARDVAPIRDAIRAAGAVVALWVAGETMFDASVHTIVIVVERGRTQGPVARWFGPSFVRQPDGALPDTATWSSLIADLFGVPAVMLAATRTVGDIATVTADFRDQYYGLVGAVLESSDVATGPRLVPSGLVDLGRCAWGERSVRFAKQSFAQPRVNLDLVDDAMQAWARRRLVPKVLVAAQTRVVKACADVAGDLLPSVPVVSVVPHDAVDVWFLTAVLCSPPIAAWAASRTFGAGLQPDAIKLSASQVATAPLPERGCDAAIALLKAGDIEAYGLAMCAAFGTEADGREAGGPEAIVLMEWWLPRTKSRLRS
jgi:methylase of polypeptide subunit release factors